MSHVHFEISTNVKHRKYFQNEKALDVVSKVIFKKN